jgi:hypothetical protein
MASIPRLVPCATLPGLPALVLGRVPDVRGLAGLLPGVLFQAVPPPGRVMSNKSARIWVHKVCGEPVDSELMYSDAEQDYYQPICNHCRVGLEMKDMEFRYRLLPENAEVLRASGDYVCPTCGKIFYDHEHYAYQPDGNGGAVKGCDGRFYHL